MNDYQIELIMKIVREQLSYYLDDELAKVIARGIQEGINDNGRDSVIENEKLDKKDYVVMFAWAHNTAGYWSRQLNQQDNDKGIALVLISQEDVEMLEKIRNISFDLGSAINQETAQRETENQLSTKKTDKGLKKIFRCSKGSQ